MSSDTVPELYMPAEWERHQCTLMAWPVKEADWPEPFEEVLDCYRNIVKAISEFEPVTLIAKPKLVEQAKSYCGDFAEIVAIDHDDSWLRDSGPTFVYTKNNELVGIDWVFNAWGNKFPHEKDKLAAREILSHLDIMSLELGMIMEGGAIHVDGEGTLLTTESCVLNPNRNPFLKPKVEDIFFKYLGAKKVIWLKEGLYGDDTDGHIDNVACFIAPGVLMLQVCSDPNDPNYLRSKLNKEILQNSTDANGRQLKIIEIEGPSAMYYEDKLLTLSYLNFYLVNDGAILPIFGEINCEKDQKAIEVLQKAMPNRKIVAVNGLAVARQGGNVHCLTQQVPIEKRS
jgi:agmatine deiminase